MFPLSSQNDVYVVGPVPGDNKVSSSSLISLENATKFGNLKGARNWKMRARGVGEKAPIDSSDMIMAIDDKPSKKKRTGEVDNRPLLTRKRAKQAKLAEALQQPC